MNATIQVDGKGELVASDSAIQRLKFAHRVSNALIEFRDLVAAEIQPFLTVQVANAGDIVVGDENDAQFRGDFIVGVSNIQLRLLLLVGQSASALRAASTNATCAHILLSNLEVSACVVVADDSDLSSRILEAEDLSDRTSSNSRNVSEIAELPLIKALQEYVRDLVPIWDLSDIESSVDATSMSYADQVQSISTRILETRRAIRATIEEKKAARDSLTDEDAHNAASMATAVMRGELNDEDLQSVLGVL